jgi:hypothetical protein
MVDAADIGTGGLQKIGAKQNSATVDVCLIGVGNYGQRLYLKIPEN